MNTKVLCCQAFGFSRCLVLPSLSTRRGPAGRRHLSPGDADRLLGAAHRDLPAGPAPGPGSARHGIPEAA